MIEDALKADVISFIKNKGSAAITVIFPCVDMEKFSALEANSILLIPTEWGRDTPSSLITTDTLSDCILAMTVDNNSVLYLFGIGDMISCKGMITYLEGGVTEDTFVVYAIPSYQVGWKDTLVSPSSPVKRSTIPFL